MALLEIAMQEPKSYLKRLHLARCRPSLSVLDLVATTVSNQHCSLEKLELQFTEQAARNVLLEASEATSSEVRSSSSSHRSNLDADPTGGKLGRNRHKFLRKSLHIFLEVYCFKSLYLTTHEVFYKYP